MQHAAKSQRPQLPLLEQLLNASSVAGDPALSTLCTSLHYKPVLVVANKVDVTASSSPEPRSLLPYSEIGAQTSTTGSASPTSFHEHHTACWPDGEDRPLASSAAEASNLKGRQGSGHGSAADSTQYPAARPEGPVAAPNVLSNRPDQIQWISCRTGEGLQTLEQQLDKAVAHVIHGDNAHLGPPLMTR